jgi:purine-binding chemotaxis protein CheW
MTPANPGMAEQPPLVVLTLELQGELFAIEAAQVYEILDPVPVTDVPGADAAVNGLINVRGRIVPLADPRRILGMTLEEGGIDVRFIVLEVVIDGDPVSVAIRADKVHEVAELSEADIEATPRLGVRWPATFIRGIAKRHGRFVTLLDLGRVFAALRAGTSLAA